MVETALQQGRQSGEVAQYLNSRGIPESAVEQFQLGQDGPWLCIPYLTPTGVIGIKKRHMRGGEPKNMAEPGSGVHLYNAQALIHATHVIICEGEMDAIAIQSLTGIPAVGVPGVSQWTATEHKHWKLCFDGVRRLAVADGDEVGRGLAQRIAADLNCRWVDMPDGEDANSYLAKYGVDAFKELVKS